MIILCLTGDSPPAQAQNTTHTSSMSKMHSWPPTQQGIERPMSDLDPVFSVPTLPTILCPVPEEGPLPAAAVLAKTGSPSNVPVADMEQARQAEELRRVLRSMYKSHFQMHSEVRCILALW